MELKDIFYTVGILVTMIVSIIALLVNIKNRRNGMREHLYKEQMKFFTQLAQEIYVVNELLSNISVATIITEEQVEKLEAAYDKVDLLTETYDFITPDEILSKLYLLHSAWHEIVIKLIKAESITKENISKFKQIFWDLTEDIREHLGVDKLSDENRRISFGRQKLTETDKK